MLKKRILSSLLVGTILASGFSFAFAADTETATDTESTAVEDTENTSSEPSQNEETDSPQEDNQEDNTPETVLYAVSILESEGGKTTASLNIAEAGLLINLIESPNEGWQSGSPTVVDTEGNTIAVTDNGNGTYTFTMPASAVTVSPNFKELKTAHTINISAQANGSISTASQEAEKGETVTVAVSPNDGYTLQKLTVISDDGTEVAVKDSGNGSYSFTMPNANVSVQGSFQEEYKTHEIYIPVQTEGSASASPQTAKKGATVVITVSANSGYENTGLVLTDDKGNSVQSIQNSDGSYAFEMPDTSVIAVPSFSKKEEETQSTDSETPGEQSTETQSGSTTGTGTTSETTTTSPQTIIKDATETSSSTQSSSTGSTTGTESSGTTTTTEKPGVRVMSVYVPAELPIKVANTGDVVFPTEAVIRSNVTKGDIVVQSIRVKTSSDWSPATKIKAGKGKQIVLSLRENKTNSNGTVDLSEGNWCVKALQKLPLNMNVELTEGVQLDDQPIAQVEFILDWGEES